MALLQSKNHITAIIKLMARHQWLIDRSDALDQLQAECTTDAELELVFDLLSRFDYLGDDLLSDGFRAMAEQISTAWGLNPAETIICPPKFDSSADSGPAVVQTLKTIFGKKNIRGFELIISINKIRDYAKQRGVIVLVDDFAGTGRTVANKLKNIRELPAYQGKAPKIFVCILAAAQVAREAIEPHVEGYFVWREYRKGITDHYEEPKLSAAKELMRNMECRLAPTVRKVDLPRFGYGETEVLMGWDSNLPNSVFPIFWWPESLAAEQGESEHRTTLFSRFF